MLSFLDAAVDKSWKSAPPVSVRTAAALVAAACALPGGAALAGPYDALHPYASLAYSYDDNLFRLPDSSPGYDNQRDDRSTQLQAGLLFNKTYGRQEIALQAKVSRVTFSHFSALDYNGKDMLADWGWHLGAHLDGTLGVRYSETLAPYTDIVTRERNLRTQRSPYLTGGWLLHPSWRLRGALTQDRYGYDLASLAYNDHDDNGVEAGVDYLAASGGTVGLQLNKTRHRYDQLRHLGPQLVSADTDQDDIKLKVYWRATGISNVQFLGGWSRRTHSFFTERDASGFNAKLKAATELSGKWSADASVWRQFDGVESSVVSYSLNTGALLHGSWVLTSKIQANAQFKYEKRRFQGLLAATAPSDISDISRSSSVGVTYALLPSVQLGVSAFRDARNGLAARLFSNGIYHAKGVSFNVNLQY